MGKGFFFFLCSSSSTLNLSPFSFNEKCRVFHLTFLIFFPFFPFSFFSFLFSFFNFFLKGVPFLFLFLFVPRGCALKAIDL